MQSRDKNGRFISGGIKQIKQPEMEDVLYTWKLAKKLGGIIDMVNSQEKEIEELKKFRLWGTLEIQKLWGKSSKTDKCIEELDEEDCELWEKLHNLNKRLGNWEAGTTSPVNWASTDDMSKECIAKNGKDMNEAYLQHSKYWASTDDDMSNEPSEYKEVVKDKDKVVKHVVKEEDWKNKKTLTGEELNKIADKAFKDEEEGKEVVDIVENANGIFRLFNDSTWDKTLNKEKGKEEWEKWEFIAKLINTIRGWDLCSHKDEDEIQEIVSNELKSRFIEKKELIKKIEKMQKHIGVDDSAPLCQKKEGYNYALDDIEALLKEEK